MERVIPASELIINPDGSVFHLHIKPEMLVDNIILVGDPGRVEIDATIINKKKNEESSSGVKEKKGEYQGKRGVRVRVARYCRRQHRYCGQ